MQIGFLPLHFEKVKLFWLPFKTEYIEECQDLVRKKCLPSTRYESPWLRPLHECAVLTPWYLSMMTPHPQSPCIAFHHLCPGQKAWYHWGPSKKLCIRLVSISQSHNYTFRQTESRAPKVLIMLFYHLSRLWWVVTEKNLSSSSLWRRECDSTWDKLGSAIEIVGTIVMHS